MPLINTQQKDDSGLQGLSALVAAAYQDVNERKETSVIDNASLDLTPQEEECVIGFWKRHANLDTLKFHYTNLIKLGYSKEHTLKLASANSGSDNIKAILKLHNEFIKLKFSREQLVRICGCNNGAMNLYTVIELYPSLMELGLSIEDITSLGSGYNGVKNLNTFGLYFNKLTQLGYSKEQLVKAGSFDEGFRNLEGLLTQHSSWINLNYSINEIFAVAAERWGYSKLYKPVAKVEITREAAPSVPSSIVLDSDETLPPPTSRNKGPRFFIDLSKAPLAKRILLPGNNYIAPQN